MGYGDMLFYLVLIVTLGLLSYKTSGDNILIDCGSHLNTTVGDRVFLADNYSTEYLTTPLDIVSSNNSCDNNVLYNTARIFKGKAMYNFPISQAGRYFIRLYFCPFISFSFDLSKANFSVYISQLVILKDFNPQFPVMKEFSYNITSGSLMIILAPAYNSMAYLNALEISLIPDSLIQNKAISVRPIDKFIGLEKMALETMFRVNVGGSFIGYDNDSLWRTWESDNKFLENQYFTRIVEKNIEAIHYAKSGGLATKYDAPLVLYSSCRRVKIQDDPSKTFNVTWNFEIDQGYQYLIRFHFCDIVSKSLGELQFNVYVNSWIVSPNLDISFLSNGCLDTPVFLDFVTPVIEHNQIHIHIGPTISSEIQHDGILNGLEIMKMNHFKILSATSVPLPPSPQSELGLKSKIGVMIGEIFGAFILLVFVGILYLLNWRNKKLVEGRSRNSTPHSPILEISMDSTVATTQFSYTTIEQATNSFDEGQFIGHGGFGRVYIGTLEDGTTVAVKRGIQGQSQGPLEFVNEIKQLSQFRHRHLVPLIGYCAERTEMIIVYMYMENGSLRSHLYGSSKPSLSWIKRLEICIGAAKGIHYLHTGIYDNKVIHRDIKSENILLDRNLSAVITDFGISKILLDHLRHTNTTVKGTFGYLDPYYMTSTMLTEKSDVYSFGVVLFEVICARAAIDESLPEDQMSLTQWAVGWHRKDQLEEIIDPNLKGTIKPECLQEYGAIAEKCVSFVVDDRPSIGEVLWKLESVLQLETAVSDVPESSNSEITYVSDVDDLVHLPRSAVLSQIVELGGQ